MKNSQAVVFGKMRHTVLLTAGLLPFLAGAPAVAQQSSDAASGTDETVKLEKYVVTGSNIPLAADALAVPVLTIDSKVVEQSGVNSDMLEILRKVAPNISGIGQENAQIATGTNFGGASVTVKGLPTLVLINGRRVANDPAEGTGGNNQFVDLNLIPVAAIDRIEVLQDGASAIYGSDAIGGVINILLKKNYNNWEMGAHFGYSSNTGHYSERSGYVVGGVSNSKTSITIGLDYTQHDAMYLADRTYTNPIYGTYTFPGSLEVYDNSTGADQFYQLAPGVNAPPGGGLYTIDQLVANGVYVPKNATQQFQTFNLANAETLTGYLKRYSAMINFEHNIFANSLVAFGDVLAAHTFTWSALNAQPLVPFLEDPWVDVNVFGYAAPPPPAGTTYVPSTVAGNPFSQSWLDQNQAVPETAPGFGDGSGFEVLARNRFIAFPRRYENDSTLIRVVGGLRGDITEDLHWEAAANLNRYTLNYTNPGLIDTNALQNALASGQINPFAIVQAPGAFDGVVGTAFVNMLSTLYSFDVKLDGTLFELPGGKFGFAAGGSYVRESLSADPDVNSLPNSTGSTQGWSNATTFENFEAVRNVTSAFAEINVPITGPGQNIAGAHSINLDAAIRYDSYSGKVGSTVNPQANLSWEPVDDQFKLRGSLGKSFIAPQLYQLYGPTSSGSTPGITYNIYNGNGAQNLAQFNQVGGSNPDLRPTTANAWTVGFVYTPKQLKGLSITVDHSYIDEKEIAGLVPSGTIIQSVETLGTASPFVNAVHFNSPTGPLVTGPGAISSHSPQSIYVLTNLVNLGGQKVSSTDIHLDYTWKVAGVGKFDLSSAWTWYNSYQLQIVPIEPFYQYSGTASTNETTIPKWRSYSTLEWSNKGLDAFIGATYVESVTDVGVGGDNQFGFEQVPSFVSLDAGLSYDFKALHLSKWLDGLKVTIGANNLANKLPPLAINAFPDTNADVGNYDGAIGRMLYINAKYSF